LHSGENCVGELVEIADESDWLNTHGLLV